MRIAAFSRGQVGGNPAGVMITDTLPDPSEMQRIAGEVGYSETAFAMPLGAGWRVRYFSPETEVPFCGHATIALGAALALQEGDGIFDLTLNHARITVEGKRTISGADAALQSPPTRSSQASDETIDEVLSLFGYGRHDLDQAIPPAIVHGGANHFALTLNSIKSLASMSYDMSNGGTLMTNEGWVTIILAFAETPRRFRARNAFASGGVYEDPATGAAAAAFAGYLRDIGWPHKGQIEILQGEEMGMSSHLLAEIPPEPGSSIRVSGSARMMTSDG